MSYSQETIIIDVVFRTNACSGAELVYIWHHVQWRIQGGFGGFDRTPLFGWLCYKIARKIDMYCERSRLHGTPLSAF